MNSAIKNQEKPFHKKPHPGHAKNRKPKIDKSHLPLFAFLILDLTDLNIGAKIIRITQLLVHTDGETSYSEHLFNPGDQEISEKAAQYHKLTKEMLQDKPDVKTFNFEQAQNLVVWDGQVTRNILRHNGIKKYSSLINMHSLARYLYLTPSPIKMNDFAMTAMPDRKNVLEFKLQKPENKVTVMPDILKYLKSEYKKRFDEDRISFLVAVGRSPNKEKALETIDKFLKKRKTMEAYDKGLPPVKPEEEGGKKVIIVSTLPPKNDAAKSAKKYKPRTTVKPKKK